MIYENDEFTDEKKMKHPKPPDKICKVDEDSKPEIASQAPSKPLFQPISNKYKDNVDPTKNLCCSNRVKKKKKEAEDYITESTVKDKVSVTDSISSSSTNDTANKVPAKPIQELPVNKSRELRNLESDFAPGYYQTAQTNSTTLKATNPTHLPVLSNRCFI